MNPKDKKKFRHDKQVFNQENSAFVVLLEKTMNKQMRVVDAMAELNVDRYEWAKLKRVYFKINGLNS
ncbi:MAG: hypothetical protein LBI45_00625 [Bacteroidales bacterium]|jgi:hypothetical protein|nr:hypothetical protein [Bacteroidales bacterium]